METMVLERFVLDAEAAFEQKEILEGMGLLEKALTIEPNYSKAHNHLGWAYLTQLNDWKKAEKHLQFALKGNPVYGPAYIHMSQILFNKGKYTELSALLNEALENGEVDRAFIFNEFGRMFESSGRFRKAITNYKKAINFSFEDKELKTIKDNIYRCRQKRRINYF